LRFHGDLINYKLKSSGIYALLVTFPPLPSFLTLDFEFLSITVRALNGLDISSAAAFHTSGRERERERERGGGRAAKLLPTHHAIRGQSLLSYSVVFCFLLETPHA